MNMLYLKVQLIFCQLRGLIQSNVMEDRSRGFFKYIVL